MSLELALKGLISEVLKEAGAITVATPAGATPVPAQPRGRGRPPKPPEGAPAAPAPAAALPEPADPFAAAPAAPPVPTATLDDVRNALTTLRAATTQENALKVLNDSGGAGNLTDLKPENYGKVVQAAKAATPQAGQPAADPFAATPAPAAAPAPKALTLEDVRAVIVETQKRTSADTCKKVVMDHGGKAPKPDGGGDEASLKALPEANYAATIAALKALPSTK